jgi:TolB protein
VRTSTRCERSGAHIPRTARASHQARWASALLLAVCLGAAVVAAVSEAARPAAAQPLAGATTTRAVPATRQIACVRPASMGRDIWLMSDTGVRLQRLTRSRSGDYLQTSPAWSPDGKTLLYVDWEGVTNDTGARLWVVDADGRNAHRLMPDGVLGDMESIDGWDVSPAWSADGARVAFVNTMNLQGDPAYAWGCLAVYDTITQQANRLYRVPANWRIEGIVWSRDGGTIEFAIDNRILHSRQAKAGAVRRAGLMSQLRSIDVATGTVRTLATAAKGTIFTGLSRSPGGGWIAVTRTPWLGGRAAVQVAPIGGKPRRTVVRASSFTTRYLQPTWSPNGKRIAYSLSSPNGDSVWIVNADGSGDHKAIPRASAPSWRPR